MSYRLREHTADVAVEASGETFGAVIGALGDGLAAAMCEAVPDAGERFEFTVAAESREALVFDVLDRLIYERDVRAVLPVDVEVDPRSDGEWTAEVSARGVPLSTVDAREVKAVTYSEMELEEADDGWHAYVVFDV